jgi:hypothetical protein
MKDTRYDVTTVKSINKAGIHNLCRVTFECGKRPGSIIGSVEVVIRARELIRLN